MTNSVIDYTEGSSFLHKANPITKVFLAIELFAAGILAPNFPAICFVIVLTLFINIISGNAKKAFKLLWAFSVIGAFMFVVQALIARSGEPVWYFITDQGLITAGNVALRTIALALPLLSMLALTRMEDLTGACVEVLHIPYRYAFTVTTALRFVPIFLQEMTKIKEAQTARGIEFDSKNPFRRLKLQLPFIVPLIVSSVKKADATALSAEQRGFYLRTRKSSLKRYPMRFSDIAVLLLGFVVLIAIALW